MKGILYNVLNFEFGLQFDKIHVALFKTCKSKFHERLLHTQLLRQVTIVKFKNTLTAIKPF